MYSRYRPATIFPALVLFGLFFPCSFGVVHSQVTGTNIPQHPASTVGFRKLTIMTSRSLAKSSSFIGKKRRLKMVVTFPFVRFPACLRSSPPPATLAMSPTLWLPNKSLSRLRRSPPPESRILLLRPWCPWSSFRWRPPLPETKWSTARPSLAPQICCHLYPMCGAWGRVGS